MKRLLAVTGLAILLVAQSDVCCGQWVQADGNGFYGSFFESRASIGNKLLIGTEDGLFLSTDTGSSWKNIGFGPYQFYNDAIENLAVIGNTIFASSQLSINDTFRTLEMHSTDSGVSWTPDTGFQPDERLLCSIGSQFYVGSNGYWGIFVSSDSGKSFFKINLADSSGIESIASIGTTLLFETTVPSNPSWYQVDNLVSYSTSNGESWNYSIRNCSGLCAIGDTLYTGADGGLFQSIDTGATWQQIGIGKINSNVTHIIGFKGNIFASNPDGLFRSRDGGATWFSIPNWTGGIVLDFFAFENNLFIATVNPDSRMLFKSTDTGTTWVASSQNYSTIGGINSLSASKNALFAGSYRTTDLGMTWVLIDSLDMDYSTFYSFGNRIFVTSETVGVIMSTDDGNSWMPSNAGLPPLHDTTEYWYGVPLAICSLGSNIFLGVNGYGIYTSSDSGNTWEPDLRGNSVIDSFPTQLIACDGFLLLVTKNDGIFRSADTGKTWFPLNQVFAAPLYSIGSDIFATYSPNNNNGIFRSSDDGDSWQTIAGSSGIYIGGIFPGGIVGFENNIFISDGSKLFFSSDYGDNWTDFTSGLPQNGLGAIALFDGNILIVDDGVWRRPLYDFGISSVAQTPEIGSNIQSYPNPFTQSTTITFSSQDEGYADVTVVNLLGEQVARIFSGELAPGEHSFSWDASGFAPGMYECIVRMNGNVRRVSMIYSR